MSDSLQPMDYIAHQTLLSFTFSQCLLKLMSIESVMPSNRLIFCRPLRLSSVFPSTGSFPASRLFASGGQSSGASASALVLPVNIQGGFPLGLTGFYLFAVLGTLKSSTVPQFASINSCTFSQLSHLHMTVRRTISFTVLTFVGKVISLLRDCSHNLQ